MDKFYQIWNKWIIFVAPEQTDFIWCFLTLIFLDTSGRRPPLFLFRVPGILFCILLDKAATEFSLSEHMSLIWQNSFKANCQYCPWEVNLYLLFVFLFVFFNIAGKSYLLQKSKYYSGWWKSDTQCMISLASDSYIQVSWWWVYFLSLDSWKKQTWRHFH